MNTPRRGAKTSPGWVQRLSSRWNVSTGRVFIILLVFACTGTTVMLLKGPVLALFTGDSEPALIHSILYYVFILPVYNIVLLIYGFLFGQFKFFWEFEKRFVLRIIGRK